ncbi:MAG: DnaA N-terminal domain-containing protein [Planctomycetota bacterium]|jgi:chromosomal replication initiation ATPase DnaA
MQSLLQETWSRIEPELRARTGEAVFDAWLAELRPMAMERGILHLEAKNRLVCERVTQMFSGLIAECLSSEFGTAIAVAVEPVHEGLLGELEVSPSQPIVDNSNRTAFLALRALLEERSLPSPLFLFHGQSGAGKSFLLDWWLGLYGKRCQRFTAAQLSRAYQACFKERRVGEFRAELCADRPLMVDEVHRLSGQPRIQEEFATVLEERAKLEVPTLLGSRWHPREIWRIGARLRTWLGSGMVTQIELPGPEARLRYLRALEGPPSRNGRASFIENLAREVKGSYPELRRAWAMQKHGRGSRYWELIDPRSTFDRFADRVADALGVSVDEMVGQSQSRRISMARKTLAWVCVQQGLSRAEIGRFLGGRTRAAISYGIKTLNKRLEGEPELRRQIESLL